MNKELLYISSLLKKENSLGNPIVENIEPTNACMMDCIMCPHRLMKRKVEFMNLDLFKKIIDQINWNEYLWLHHFGESFLHPDIFKMIDYTAEKGIKARISVNPVILSEEICRKIINSRLHLLIISLDGTDNKTYKSIRGKNADYNLAVKNIEFLLELKSEAESDLKIHMQMVKTELNQDQCEKYKLIWEREGIDEVGFATLLLRVPGDKNDEQ